MSPVNNITIDKATLNTLPVESFPGRIHIIEEEQAAIEAVAELCRHAVLGIDTETRPSFRKGRSNKVALIQLSTHDDCYLFRINKIGLIAPLRDLLSNADIVKIGLSLRDDLSVLHRVDSFEPANFIDLQSIVQQYGIGEMSLQKIYAIVFGKKISKAQRLSNWDAPELTIPQQHYAALDAWACLQLYEALIERRPFYFIKNGIKNK